MLVVRYYTPLYKFWADRLNASCRRLGVESRIVKWRDRGTWEGNCAGKGGFVASCLRDYKRPILWLDADCEVLRPLGDLVEIAKSCDFGVCEFIRNADEDKFRLRSGTVLMCPTPEGRHLADRWASLCDADPQTWDQAHLWTVFQEAQERGSRVALLDRSYCFIFDESDPIKDPHIIQYQGSREYRKHHAADTK